MIQQLVESNKSIKRDKREGKGRVLAISRRIYRLQKTDMFYVESESSDNTYYVKYQPSDLEWCSCRDNSTRGIKCKHIWSIEFAIRLRIIKDTDRLPIEAKVKKKSSNNNCSNKTNKFVYRRRLFLLILVNKLRD